MERSRTRGDAGGGDTNNGEAGRRVKNVLDSNGDLSIVQSAKCMDAVRGTDADCTSQGGMWNYAQHFSFNAAGAVTSMQLGNGRWESTQFNSQLQPTQIALGATPNATNHLKLNYSYGTTTNNGNVLSQTITVPTVGQTAGFVATQSYAYDSLNRLQSAEETIASQTSWKQVFTFDRYGNRNFDEAQTTTLPKGCIEGGNPVVCAADRKVFNPSATASDNRLRSADDYVFDTAGNTTNDPQGRTFIYDAENKQIEVRDSQQNIIGQYRYDGDGRRMKKIVPGTGEVTVFVYSASGQLVAEYSTEISQDHKVSYTTADHLGSPRILTDENGKIISRRDFHPFGEEVATSHRTSALGYQPDDVRQGFTGYENDTETGLEFAQARMYSKGVGRFVSADPRIFRSVFEPGAWNLYAYALNHPLGYTDRDGLWPTWIHRAISDRAFPGLDPTARAEIARGNAEVDVKGWNPVTLDPRNSHQHSQTSDWGNDDVGTMQRKRSEFIAAAEAVAGDPANRYSNGLGKTQANEAFGRSRHPMQDARSPSHSGRNSHYATPSLLAMTLATIPVGLDFISGMVTHKLGERKIDTATFASLVREEREAYKRIFGVEALAIATDTRRYTNEFVKSDFLRSHLDDLDSYGQVVGYDIYDPDR